MKKINKKRVHWQANVASPDTIGLRKSLGGAGMLVASPFPVVPVDVDGSIIIPN